MDRERDDFVELSGDDSINEHLNRQLSIYTHTQKRAERLIQLLIASFTLVTAFGNISALFGLFEYLESEETNSLLGILIPFTLPQQELFLDTVPIPFSVSLLFIGLILIVESITWAAEVVIMPKPRPHLGSSDMGILKFRNSYLDDVVPLEYSRSQTDLDRLKNDIKYNQAILSEMDRYLKRSYQILPLAIGFILFSIVPQLAGAAGDVSTLVLLSGFVSLIVTIGVIKAIIAVARMFVGSYKSKGRPIDFILNSFRSSSQVGGLHTVYYMLIMLLAAALYIVSLFILIISVFAWIS